jgi:hypothetical protein
VTVSHPDFLPSAASMNVNPESTANADFILAAKPITITGAVNTVQTNWMSGLSKEVQDEIEALKTPENHNKIVSGLQNSQMHDLFLRQPGPALKELGINISDNLLALTKASADYDEIMAAAPVRLPDGTTVNPTITINITGDPPAPSPGADGAVKFRDLYTVPQFKPYGEKTHGYNVVVEFQAGKFQDVVQTNFTNNTFAALMQWLGLPEAISLSITVMADLGRPAIQPTAPRPGRRTWSSSTSPVPSTLSASWIWTWCLV